MNNLFKVRNCKDGVIKMSSTRFRIFLLCIDIMYSEFVMKSKIRCNVFSKATFSSGVVMLGESH
jgi:hypothetical protein